jgi:5'-deoxynucleotidase YfbR-like HD superfamily hydrolase
VLAALAKNKDKTYPTNFRIADFAQFVLKVADADGRLAEAETMFNRLAAEQLAFASQGDSVLELLEDWIALEGGSGKEITTARLFDELRRMANSSQRAFDFKSAKAFGQYLQNNRATLNAFFGATDRTAGGRKHLWRFNLPESVEGDIPTPVDREREKEELRASFEKMHPITVQ